MSYPATAPPVLAAGAATAEESAVAGRRARNWLVVIVPALAELLAGGYRLGDPSLWRDEGYTAEMARRPVGDIIATLGHEDAMHGLYYLFMHFVVAAAGTSEVALRLPSLLATSLTAAMTAVLARRLARETGLPAPSAVGLLAGLLLAAIPLTTWYAQDARPYGLVTLCAVTASWLLVRGRASSRWQWWAAYTMVVALLGYLNLFALLLVAAHGVSLLIARRPAPDSLSWTTERRWLAAGAGATVLLAPLLVVGGLEAGQLNWVPKPSLLAVVSLMTDFSGARLLVPVVAALAGGCALVELVLRRRPGLTTATIALPWLVVPPATLLAVSAVEHVYLERYVVFCTPALALLTASGLGWLARLATPAAAGTRRRLAATVPSCMLVVAMAAVLTGPQLSIRLTAARPDNLRAVAAVVAAHELPGDAVVYLPWSARIAGLAYPAPFQRLRAINQAKTGTASGTLTGVQTKHTVLAVRLRSVQRLWVVCWEKSLKPSDVTFHRRWAWLFAKLQLISSWHVGTVNVGLYSVRQP